MRLNPDDPASDHGRRDRLQGLGLLPNPNDYPTCAAMPSTSPHPLLSIYENIVRDLGDELDRSRHETEAAFTKVRELDRHGRRCQDALAWLQSEYELDDVAHDVIAYARSGVE